MYTEKIQGIHGIIHGIPDSHQVWHNSHVFPIKRIIFKCLDNNLCISEISKGLAYAVTNNYIFYRSSSRFIILVHAKSKKNV